MKPILLIFGCFFTINLNAQIFKYRTMDFMKINPKGEFENKTQCDYLVVVNFNKSKINIYTPEMQEYNLVYKEDKTETDTTLILGYQCIDVNGNECRLKLFLFKDEIYAVAIFYPNHNDFTYTLKRND